MDIKERREREVVAFLVGVNGLAGKLMAFVAGINGIFGMQSMFLLSGEGERIW